MTDAAATPDLARDDALFSSRGLGTGRRRRGAIVDMLGVAILSGKYRPGHALPGEVISSRALGVSRSAYREAVCVLAAKGLVESRTRTGTRVLPRNRWSLLDPDVLAWAFTGKPDSNLVRALLELRVIIEPAAAALAATRHNGVDLDVMKEALAGMRRYPSVSEAAQVADCDFHDAVLSATHNDVFAALSAGIRAAVKWTTRPEQRASCPPHDHMSDQVRVYEAIAAGDPIAADAAMRALIDHAYGGTPVETR